MPENNEQLEKVLKTISDVAGQNKAFFEAVQSDNKQKQRIDNLEQKIKQLEDEKKKRVHIASLWIAGISGVFLLLVSINNFFHTNLIADGKVSPLKTEYFGWLLAHDALLTITGLGILGISLFIAFRHNQDD
jgi:hypothetical protein